MSRQAGRRYQERISQLEKELEESRRRPLPGHAWSTVLLESIVNNTQNIIYVRDRQGRHTLVNDRFCRSFGLDRDAVLGRSCSEIFPGEAASLYAANDRLVAESGKPMTFPEHALLADGRHEYISTKFPIWDASGSLVAVGGISTDVTDQVRMQASLRASEEKFRLAFHTIPLAINLNRVADGVYIDINEGFTALTGYTREEAIGRSSLELNIWADPGDRERLVEGLRTSGLVENLQARFKRKNGEIGVGVMSARTLRIGDESTILSITRDITAELELEERYLQAQKMEAVGKLAGGVAHDFNNLLIPILSYSEMVKDSLPPGDERRRMMHEILEASDRAATLTRQILAFSRKQVMDLKPVELGSVVAGFQRMIVRLVKENIEVRVGDRAGKACVRADRLQIEQILLNLVVNAGDAMPDGGVLSIDTSVETLSGRREEGFVDDPAAGSYAVLTVEDTGSGMDPATLGRIFEPFFTTKERGKGTGLGLSTVLGITTQHKGHVWVSSAAGRGTTFKVFLPLCAERVAPGAGEKSGAVPLHGTEKILVVEDDPHVGDLVCKALRQYGYQVSFAANGGAALGLLGEGGLAGVQLLLTDVIMPGLNGKELYAALSRGDPRLRVLYMSGYADDVIVHHGLLDDGVDLLQKPFTARELLGKVRAVLERPR